MLAIGEMMGKALAAASRLRAHNWWAIIYFNFRMLPIRQALKLPFDFSHAIRFERLSGRIDLNVSCPTRAMIRIGGRGSEMFPRSQTIVDIAGMLQFNGHCEIGHGALLRVEPAGRLIMGHRVRLGAMTRLFCAFDLQLGNEIDFSWECQIFDTNFHWLRNESDGRIDERVAPVSIGDRNWFGNRVTVMRGCHTGSDVTVASNSLCNRDYRSLGKALVLAGAPAVVVRQGVVRLFEGVDIPETGLEGRP